MAFVKNRFCVEILVFPKILDVFDFSKVQTGLTFVTEKILKLNVEAFYLLQKVFTDTHKKTLRQHCKINTFIASTRNLKTV